jgi:MOSC domain-containing protein YiiM
MLQEGMIVGVFAGGVASFVVPDGRPLTTGIRKSQLAKGLLESAGFRGDASAEPDHHKRPRSSSGTSCVSHFSGALALA